MFSEQTADCCDATNSDMMWQCLAPEEKYKNNFMNCVLDAVIKRAKMRDYQRKLTVQDAICTVGNAWNDVDKSIIRNAWHKTWPITMFNENSYINNKFKWFRVTNEMISHLVTYAKSSSGRSVGKLEVNIKIC